VKDDPTPTIESPTAVRFADALEASRQFLLAMANAQLPPSLRAKGGASDLVQETLATAHRARHQFHGRTLTELRAWLRAILANEVCSFRRAYAGTAARDVTRELPVESCEPSTADESALGELIRLEDEDRLREAVAGLPERSRMVVALRAECGYSFARIGEHLGCTEEAARKVFARAVEQLRELAPADAA
jgi:RNA polymerase sigma-70 factor (ECF subfamily)